MDLFKFQAVGVKCLSSCDSQSRIKLVCKRNNQSLFTISLYIILADLVVNFNLSLNSFAQLLTRVKRTTEAVHTTA